MIKVVGFSIDKYSQMYGRANFDLLRLWVLYPRQIAWISFAAEVWAQIVVFTTFVGKPYLVYQKQS